MITSERMAVAVKAAREEYFLGTGLIFNVEEGAIPASDRITNLAVAVVSAGVDGASFDKMVVAGCRAYMGLSDKPGDPDVEDVARGLVEHNSRRGAVRRACERAWEGWRNFGLGDTSDCRTAVVESGKRLGVVHVGMDSLGWDWFTTWSPRNSNSNGEGPWEHFVGLAIDILRDPLTAIVHPDAYRTMAGVEPLGCYSSADRCLTEAELTARFADVESDDLVMFYSR